MTTTTAAAENVTTEAVRELSDLRASDVGVAGGKGANLGELRAMGAPVPDGFVVTAAAWVAARDANAIVRELERVFAQLDPADDEALERACSAASRIVRELVIPDDLVRAVAAAHERLVGGDGRGAVMVRSSATLEDSATASFAGMNESFADVRGASATIDAVRACWASLFAPRSVAYRAELGMPLATAEIAVVVQRYLPAVHAGIMFTVDPATGDTERFVIESARGAGAAIVSGRVTPDHFVVDGSTSSILERDLHDEPGESAFAHLDDEVVARVAQLGARITAHYGGVPQDIEWLLDEDEQVWIVQTRPVTALASASDPGPEHADAGEVKVLVRGVPAAAGIASGRVRVMVGSDHGPLRSGEVLVARMTSPDWAPVMRRAAAIVTDTGGMTCHAAIVARELGVPCVVGTGDATTELRDGMLVTVDGGAGTVRAGAAAGSAVRRAQPPAASSQARPDVTATSVLVNLSDVEQVERVAGLPSDGVGLLRAETMMVDALEGEHPLSLVDEGREGEAVERLARSIRRFTSAFFPRPVTYRTIDLRTNEFRRLRGGAQREPEEANPMIGFRGAGRYAAQPQLLELETRALAAVWAGGGTNLRVMLPFVRSPPDVLGSRGPFERAGLLDDDRFQLWIMAEVPSVLHHLPRYQALGIAGISIGTNDLTQLLLGADRDSEQLSGYDATDPAVVAYIEELIDAARVLGMDTSLCGQAPAVHPGYADVLVRAGIGSISVTPDALQRTHDAVARAERRVLLEAARR